MVNVLKQFEELFVSAWRFSSFVREMGTVFQEAVRSSECEGLLSFSTSKAEEIVQRFLSSDTVSNISPVSIRRLDPVSPLRLDVWFR
jgi:hypothetical protein